MTILDRMMIKMTMTIITQPLFEIPFNVSNTSYEGLRIMIVVNVTFKCRLSVSTESAHSCSGNF